jgi:hypothetical protein
MKKERANKQLLVMSVCSAVVTRRMAAALGSTEDVDSKIHINYIIAPNHKLKLKPLHHPNDSSIQTADFRQALPGSMIRKSIVVLIDQSMLCKSHGTFTAFSQGEPVHHCSTTAAHRAS